ncbi:MAG: hypothetical protein JNL74_17555 [Fibrobacteres bacterium]|nr:hypothetical protein [Fibrobacterota bacterium]
MMQISDEIVSLKLYSQAWNFKLQGKTQEAVALFKEIIKTYPDVPYAAYSSVQLESLNLPEKQQQKTATVKALSKPDDAFLEPKKPVSQKFASNNGGSRLAVVSFVLAILSICLSLFLGYRLLIAENKIDYHQTLSTARSALYAGDKILFEKSILKAHRIAGRDNGAAFLEIEAALKRNDVNGALRALKRCPVINDEVNLYLARIKAHTASQGATGRNAQ